MKPPLKKNKIVLIHNIITHYIIPLFSQLADIPDVDLHIYFMTVSEKNRKWITKLGGQFKYKVLPGFSINFYTKDSFCYHINPSIISELINNHYDVILAAGYDSFTNQIAFFYSKLCKKPFILWSGSTINEPSFLRTVSLPLVKFMVRHSDALIAYGTRAKEYLIHLGASPDKIFLAYNTVDTHFFKDRSAKLKAEKEKLKEELGLKNREVILYVGQLIERKGLKYLLRAYSQLRDEFNVAFLIVGDGLQRNELRDLCIKDGIQDVFFVGHKQLEELPKYYAISDIFVLPSTEEIWGLVLNEAMACGLPVIATDKVGASVDLIKEGVNGYVVEAKNVEQLYQAMKGILSHPELKQSMGKKSQQIVGEGFTLDHAKQGFISVIDYTTSKKLSNNSKAS